MTDFTDGILEIECDYCEEIQSFMGEEFSDAMEEAKNDGWLNRQINGEWFNFCSEGCLREHFQDGR